MSVVEEGHIIKGEVNQWKGVLNYFLYMIIIIMLIIICLAVSKICYLLSKIDYDLRSPVTLLFSPQWLGYIDKYHTYTKKLGRIAQFDKRLKVARSPGVHCKYTSATNATFAPAVT